MQGVWARDIDALGRGGGELVKRGVYCTYPVLFCEFSPLSREREYTAKSSKSDANFNPSIKLLTIQPVPMTANFIFFPAFSDPARHDRADAQREYDIKFVLFIEIYCVGVI